MANMQTAIGTVEGIKNGDISCEELLSKIYDRIEQSQLNCFITLNKDDAIEQAIEVDKRRAEEDYSQKKLLGVP
ncbi:MAG: hypothetical protein KAT65_15600, partial [Methanophagales archaeon]|nr:hypothetical protein [Methanophagales archaeon]